MILKDLGFYSSKSLHSCQQTVVTLFYLCKRRLKALRRIISKSRYFPL